MAIRNIWTTAPIDLADPLGIWATALSGLSDEQVRRGIKHLSIATDAFPPTPGRFRASCLTNEEKRAQGMSPEEYRECAAGDRIMQSLLNGVEPEPETTRYNIRRLAQKIIDDQMINDEDWSSAKSKHSACYGTLHATIRHNWRD